MKHIMLWASTCGIIILINSCQPDVDDSVRWTFSHVIIDENPLASYRINDIQIGDINGDTQPDIWTSGRGAGAGAYQMVWYKNPSWIRYEIALGDFKYGNLGDIDGDGDLDIVVGQSWFENTGLPEQRDWLEHPLGYTVEPDLVHVGDLNGDGLLDIVFTTKHELYLLPGQGNPTKRWASYLLYKESNNRTGGCLADIDQDGDLDILWGNAWFENPSDPEVTPWLKHIIDPDWPAEARGVVGDLDADGRFDIVLSGEESDKGVAWYKAPPNLTTQKWIRNTVVSSGYEGIHSLALADFDKDGDLDIFAAEMHHGKDPDKVAIFENVDIATNQWNEHIISTFGSHNAKVGDLDGDGFPDIVGKNYQAGTYPLRIDMWKSNLGSNLSVDRWQRHIIDRFRPWKALFIAGGDVNGDGLPDIITGGWWYQNPGNAGGVWTRNTIGGELYNIAVVYDLDGDKDLDILGTKGKIHSNEFVWGENDGNGSFTIHGCISNAQGDFLQGARAAQIIPGGNVEIVLSWHNATSTQMFLVPSLPTDPWLWNVISPVTKGEQIAIGDVDRDGDLDIHLGTSWLRNDGETWRTVNAFTLSKPNADPDRVELADVDLDGDLDVVIGCEHAKAVVWAEAPQNPNDSWTEHVISTDILAMSLDTADLDNDGDIDIVVGEHNTSDPSKGRVIIYVNNNNGRSWEVKVIDSGLEHHDGTRFIDIDNDGDLDIISIGLTHSKVVLYENRAISKTVHSP